MTVITNKQSQSIIGISLLIKLVEEYGISPLTMLKKAGIDPELLNQPKATITYEQDAAFVSALLNEIKDPEIGFKAGQQFRLSAFGNMGLAAASSSTVEDAIQFFLKYIKLSYTHFDVTFRKVDDKAILRFSDLHQLDELKRFYIERDFSFVLISTRDMFPRSFENQSFKAIKFDFEQPVSGMDYERLYECPVSFSQPYNEILFDITYLNRDLPQANPLTRQILEEQCETQKVEIVGPEGYVHKIQQAIKEYDEAIPSLNEIAAKFHTTSRTIRRKLSAEGVSFQELVNNELRKEAIHYLENTEYSVEKIAQLLGYSESASFIHAFKRWTGKAPRAYRC